MSPTHSVCPIGDDSVESVTQVVCSLCLTMPGIFKLIVALHLISEINSEENIYNSNGWIPISNEKALSNTQRPFIKTPEIAFTGSWNPVHQLTENEKHFKDIIKDIRPFDINTSLIKEIHYDSAEPDEKETGRNTDTDMWQEFDNKKGRMRITINNENANMETRNPRKSKKIAEDILKDNNISIDENNITDNGKIKRLNTKHTNDNTYEVTEATEASEVGEFVYDLHSKKNNIIIPQLGLGPTGSTTEENLTSKLFKVLGNYNIRTNDDLTNYALSRNKHGPNLTKQSYGYPVQFKYNSQNYFPIDPLLAVFLSNYGHYLSGVYGFPGNYYNIYGYLAANNIHNNKPFGAYKVYSDTDSSH